MSSLPCPGAQCSHGQFLCVLLHGPAPPPPPSPWLDLTPSPSTQRVCNAQAASGPCIAWTPPPRAWCCLPSHLRQQGRWWLRSGTSKWPSTMWRCQVRVHAAKVVPACFLPILTTARTFGLQHRQHRASYTAATVPHPCCQHPHARTYSLQAPMHPRHHAHPAHPPWHRRQEARQEAGQRGGRHGAQQARHLEAAEDLHRPRGHTAVEHGCVRAWHVGTAHTRAWHLPCSRCTQARVRAG